MVRKIGLFLITIFTPFALAGDPVWLEGKTAAKHEIEVYRSASCGCCKTWIKHLEEHNFVVRDHVMQDVTPLKEKLGIPPQGYSCHTATINGKIIEGHVPAQDIKTALTQPSIRLLTVPGMVSGSPGMDMPGGAKDEFKVYAQDEEGKISVYNSYKDY